MCALIHPCPRGFRRCALGKVSDAQQRRPLFKGVTDVAADAELADGPAMAPSLNMPATHVSTTSKAMRYLDGAVRLVDACLWDQCN